MICYHPISLEQLTGVNICYLDMLCYASHFVGPEVAEILQVSIVTPPALTAVAIDWF